MQNTGLARKFIWVFLHNMEYWTFFKNSFYWTTCAIYLKKNKLFVFLATPEVGYRINSPSRDQTCAPGNEVLTTGSESESRSAEPCSALQPHGLYGPWHSPGQNTGVGSLSLLQGNLPTQGSNPGLLHCRWFLYQLSHQGSPKILVCIAYPFSVDLPNPGIKPGSPTLQVDSLPTELYRRSPHNHWTTREISKTKWSFLPVP